MPASSKRFKAARLNGLAKSREDEMRIVERVWRKDECRTARKKGKHQE